MTARRKLQAPARVDDTGRTKRCCLYLIAGSLLAMSSYPLDQKIRDAAKTASLDPRLVKAIVKVESNFDPLATSRKGAMGLMQVMPQFADECGIHAPYHSVDNLMGACKCLRKLINQYRGNVKLALAAFNAGPGNVARYGGIPPFPETRQYVRKVLSEYGRLKRKSVIP